MGVYYKIIERKKNTEPNTEFKIQPTDDFNDNMFRNYSQEIYIINEFDIIKEIKNGKDYRTSKNTKCIIKIRDNTEYLTTEKNNIVDDNITDKPVYS